MMRTHQPALMPSLLLGALLLQPVTGLASCAASSGPQTTALIELYTSEGCSSCPPADAQLAHLKQTLDPGADAIALAMHVNYWDGIGWKDPYAQKAFGTRHQWLVQTNGHDTVYTPHFFVSGIEARAWPDDLRAQVRRQNTQKAQAKLSIQGRIIQAGVLSLNVDAKLLSPDPSAALYLALTESALVSKISRGENAGATLRHDHVVRAWLGPFAFHGDAQSIQQELLLDPSWAPMKLTAVAFVQDQVKGRIVQALGATGCALPAAGP